MEWAPETIQRLRDLWDEGVSTADIGRRLGISKNAVVGKAHRLKLPARGSPIKTAGSGNRPSRARSARAGASTLPPLQSVIGHGSVTNIPKAQPVPKVVRRTAPPSPTPSPAPRQLERLPEPKYGRVIQCSWVDGDRGNWKQCEHDSVAGKTYCQRHCELCFRSVKARHEEQAERFMRRLAA